MPSLEQTILCSARASRYCSTVYDEVYSPHNGHYRQTNRLTDRYKYNKTDTVKTKLK